MILTDSDVIRFMVILVSLPYPGSPAEMFCAEAAVILSVLIGFMKNLLCIVLCISRRLQARNRGKTACLPFLKIIF